MPGEFFRPIEETQPAAPDTIKRLKSVLGVLAEKPPKNIDVDATARLNSSQTGQSLRAAEEATGITHTIYALNNGGAEKPQQLFFSLGSDFLPGKVMFQTDEVMKYEIYNDRVYRYIHTDTKDAKEMQQREKADRVGGIALMTEAEVMVLNAELVALIEDE